MRVTSGMEAGGVRPGGTTLRGTAANTPLLSPPLPACHAARAPASGRPSVCRASPSRYDFVHHNFLGRECSSAKIVLAMDVLQGYVREKRSLRPQRGSCRKWSICDGRQKNFSDIQNPCKRLSFKRSAFKSFARTHYGSEKFFRPSHCGMSADASLGPPHLSKKFLGHCPAKRRQMPRSGRLTSQNSVNRLLLEAPADDVVDGVDRDEGVLVFLEHDFLELVDLEARDDAVEHFLGLARVAALPV